MTRITAEQATRAVEYVSPTPQRIDQLWAPSTRDTVLATVLSASETSRTLRGPDEQRARRHPRRRWAVAVAAAALIGAGVLILPSLGLPAVPGAGPGTAVPAAPADSASSSSGPMIPISAPVPDGSFEHTLVLWQVADSGMNLDTIEAWTASDGWTWTRSTASASPEEESWYVLGEPYGLGGIDLDAAPTDPDQIKELLRPFAEGMGGPSEDLMYLQLVDGLLRNPVVVPRDVRRAAIAMIVDMPEVTVERNIQDPAGRDAVHLKVATAHQVDGLYVNPDMTDLLCTESFFDGELRERMIVEERSVVSALPDEMIAVLGTDRVHKEVTR